jgi:hypothetical protein
MSLYYIDNDAESSKERELDIEKMDPSLSGEKAGSLLHELRLSARDFNKMFFLRYRIDYISYYFATRNIPFRVVTHPYETDTCFQKAELLGSWSPLKVVKALYFEYSADESLYAVVVPETGCFINRARIRDLLGLSEDGYLKKATSLPRHMSFGTCSPFIANEDLEKNGGRIRKILFDTATLGRKKTDDALDDFSFGLDHRMSVQMNYYRCFEMLIEVYPDIYEDKEILNLSFKEKLVRNSGRVNITFEFSSLDYPTAEFISGIHGYGEVSVLNDYVDELDDQSLPKRNLRYKDSREVFMQNGR